MQLEQALQALAGAGDGEGRLAADVGMALALFLRGGSSCWRWLHGLPRFDSWMEWLAALPKATLKKEIDVVEALEQLSPNDSCLALSVDHPDL